MRYALRGLRRNPLYAVTCVAVIAVGVAVNAAIFSVVHSVILKPLPFEDPSRLVFVWEHFPVIREFGGRMPPARKNYREWKRQTTVFVGMAAFAEKKLVQTGAGQSHHVSTGFASANMFSLLGVKASAGRLFDSNQERPGSDHVAVLSYAARAEIGRSITLGETAYTVVGVLPPEFRLPSTFGGLGQMKPEVWVPLSGLSDRSEDEMNRELYVIARLQPGTTLDQARTEMTGIARRLEIAYPKGNRGVSAAVYPVEVEDRSPSMHRALSVLLAAVGFLLLIACANLANLTLARATLRSREVAVRLALGATRARIVRQLVTESLILSTVGALFGLALAHWSVQLMLALKPHDIQWPERIAVNLPVFAFAASASVLAALLFGLAPAIWVSRTDMSSALKSGGGWGASAARSWSRQALITVEVALALALVTGTGLMLRSFHKLVATGVGFETAHVNTIDVDLPETRYGDDGGRSRFFRNLIERARLIPGVSAVGVIDNLPLHGFVVFGFYLDGRPQPPIESMPVADGAWVTPELFRALGVRLEAGRSFTDADVPDAEKDGESVAIVNRAFARTFFDSEDPIGKRLRSGNKKRVWRIVGVAADYRPLGVDKGTRPQVFWPHLSFKTASLVVRTRMQPLSITRAIQEAVLSIDKQLVVSNVKTMDEYLGRSQSQRKFNTLLMASFAGLALVLALMGIYGVLSNLVASRGREIGIRMAIGATPRQIGRLVLRQSMIPVFLGIATGVALSLVLSRFLEPMLFKVRSRDPVTLAVAALTILLLSPIAIFVPVRRATRVECTSALREE
ncbi:MAG TPA: ABC transporter permease [Bryobacteraceae bacterium]|nr:ABC transporter permease [Bryobacteraceae bacterium]